MTVKKIWRAWVTVIGNEVMDKFASYDFDHELTEEEIHGVFESFDKDHSLFSVNEIQVKIEVIYVVPVYHLRK